MNSKTRHRVMRSFFASLLQSDLSTSEMREVAEDLAYGQLGSELGEYIREFVSHMPDNGVRKLFFSSDSLDSQSAYEIINRRRLSKKEVQQLMILAAPNLKPNLLLNASSMRDLLDRFFNIASKNEIEKFLNILYGESSDPYLKGITKRSRGR